MTRDEMDVLVEQSIRSAVASVCETMLGCSATAGKSRRVDQPLRDGAGVLALLGMAGPWNGTGTLMCGPDLACKLAGALLMTEYRNVDDDVLDAVAELANMVFGNVKGSIEAVVGSMGLSTPTTVSGPQFAMKIGGNQDWLQVPIRVCDGELSISIRLLPDDRYASTGRPQMAGHMVADQ